MTAQQKRRAPVGSAPSGLMNLSFSFATRFEDRGTPAEDQMPRLTIVHVVMTGLVKP
jgi:hypothetical protein